MAETALWEPLHLRVHLLTFEVRTTTRMVLPPFKGSALRGAWKGVLTRAYCPALAEERGRPDHAEVCPACYLTERESGPESRRPYALRPPLTHETDFPPGATLTWGMVLFGPAWLLLPYVLSAVKTMGEVHGLGQRVGPEQQRGRFILQAVYAEHPYRTPSRELIYARPQTLVFPPQGGAVTSVDVVQTAQQWLKDIPARATLRLHFHTPIRLIDQGRLVRTFAFVPFYRRLVERLVQLVCEFGDPPLAGARSLLRGIMAQTLPLAKQVRVVEDRTWWWDLYGYSSRLQKKQPMGGLMGEVLLEAPRAAWEVLLVPLLWGQVVHVGKNTAKGQGWYAMRWI